MRKLHIARRVTALGMAVVMSFALGANVFAATSQSEILANDDNVQAALQKKQELQDELDKVNATITSIQNDKKQAQATKTALEQQKAIIVEQIGVLVTSISDAEDAIEQKEQEIDEKQQDIDDKQAEITSEWGAFKDQVAAMQKLNDTGYVAMLSNVKSLYQLLTFNNTITEISRHDTQLLDNMKEQKEALNAQKEALEQAKTELEDAKAELEAQQAELETKQDELVTSIKSADASISDAAAREQAQQAVKQATEDELAAAEAAYESAVRAAIASAQSSNDRDFTSDLFVWPLPGYHKITTYFGENDAYGRSGHKGIDISGNYSTPPIYAAAGGKVTLATYSSSYGNYVVIYHGKDENGNSYSTLYAHMSSIAVSTGQEVSVSDLIGYVGSTGWSTGYHLHFEVRLNGNPVNPFNYFS